MYLSSLFVCALRNFESLQITPGAAINLFHGENASGKTAILEAIYFLSCARSFRTRKAVDIIHTDHQQLTVNGVLNKEGRKMRIGVQRGQSYTCVKVGGVALRSSTEQAQYLPVLTIIPGSSLLFTGLPKMKRHWLDWSLFHVKPNFLDTWRAYYKALRHRNAILKGVRLGADSSILSWEERMCYEARKIDSDRRLYLEDLQQHLADYSDDLLAGNVGITYKRGWSTRCSLAEALVKQREADCIKGYTQSGPHRADIEFRFCTLDVDKVLSGGQMKLYQALLVIGQAAQIRAKTGKTPIILADDIDAELDPNAQERLFCGLMRTNAQCFVTTLNPAISSFLAGQDFFMFRLRHNKAIPVIN